ncbi:hypothetical protein [Micromonospora sp. NPDC049679]|uniref:hypothetical protein n=1 Tax=Micromonospora sp. NPDC049679 TaxID=3155920 RepID=UPI0033CCA305
MVVVRVGLARAAAAEWVMREARHDAGFRGAFFSGSTTWLADDVELPPASDVDVVVVTANEAPHKLGKFVYRGVLLEVTYLSFDEFVSADEVLGCYYLASSFRIDTIIDDPTGHLRQLTERISGSFAERVWVRRRCEDAGQRIERGLRAIDVSAPFHDQVTAWMFPTSVTTQVLLVAALRNPTVRLRYLAVRGVLADYGHADLYPQLLDLLGCTRMTRQRVRYHLRELARTFDATAAVARTPFFFSTDITPAARPIAIDGSHELIDRGCHREAVFWIVATFARCHKILAADAPPDLRQQLGPAFEAVVADLGITSTEDLLSRAADVTRFLPSLWATTEAILSANPDVSAS